MAKKQQITYQQAELAIDRLTTNTAELRNIQATLDEEINKIRQGFEREIEKLKMALAEDEKTLVGYATANPTLFPPNKKSVEWGAIIISKRITPPKVDIPRGMAWEDAVESLRKIGKGEYIRTTEEVNKEGIIFDVQEQESLRIELASIGITVTQKEKINIEVKSEQIVD